ncbi:MAG: hypothetical protein WAP51_03690 [Candidatus Sungiibacteriota bacterium]
MDNIPPAGEHNRLQTLFEKKSVQWLLLMAVFFGTVAVLFVSNDRFSNDFYSYMTFPALKQKEISTRVLVTIDFGNGKKRAFEGSVASPLTAGQALRFAGEAGGMALKITLAGDVTEIEKVRNQGDKRWQWYLNGRVENRSILDATVHGGDKVLVKYE